MTSPRLSTKLNRSQPNRAPHPPINSSNIALSTASASLPSRRIFSSPKPSSPSPSSSRSMTARSTHRSPSFRLAPVATAGTAASGVRSSRVLVAVFIVCALVSLSRVGVLDASRDAAAARRALAAAARGELHVVALDPRRWKKQQQNNLNPDNPPVAAVSDDDARAPAPALVAAAAREPAPVSVPDDGSVPASATKAAPRTQPQTQAPVQRTKPVRVATEAPVQVRAVTKPSANTGWTAADKPPIQPKKTEPRSTEAKTQPKEEAKPQVKAEPKQQPQQQPQQQPKLETKPPASIAKTQGNGSTPKRYLYIIDYWERLNNIHAAMRILIRLSRVSDFTLVEPFMYESMVMRRLSTPAQFAAIDLETQTASQYMNMDHLFDMGHLATFADFSTRYAKRSDGNGVLVSAALHVFWDDSEIPLPTDRANSLFECNDVFLKAGYKRDTIGWQIAPNFHARKALCVFGEKVPSKLPRDEYIKHLFATAEAGNSASGDITCPDCSSVVILNYRKHFFDSLPESSVDLEWLRSFPPSQFGLDLAATVKRKEMDGRPFVGIQYRTGRTLSRVREMANGHHETDGVREVVAREYRHWAFACADVLIDTAIEETRSLKKDKGMGKDADTRFFLASDMFNDGWKHGEYNNDETKIVMDDLAAYFSKRLGGLVTFDPAVVALKQDVAGLSAVADASICYSADRFVAHDTSSMGWYVGEARKEWMDIESRIEECPKPEHNTTSIAQIEAAIAKFT